MSADKFRVYLHGAPGSSAELDLFGEYRAHFDYAPDRFGADTDFDLDALAHDIETRAVGRLIHLTGFSMGGYIALEVAHRLGPKVAQIDLISTVAPFQGGGFMRGAAGAPLFKLAQRQSRLFGVAVAAQRIAAQFASKRLASILFAKAAGADAALAKDADFMAQIETILRDTFLQGNHGYAREMISVTRDWRRVLGDVNMPVKIWHGTLDNWAPFAMAEYLADTLPDALLSLMNGHSHYSTLREYLKMVPVRYNMKN